MFLKFLGKAKNRPIENETSDKNEAVVISRRKRAGSGKDTQSENSRSDPQQVRSSDNGRWRAGRRVRPVVRTVLVFLIRKPKGHYRILENPNSSMLYCLEIWRYINRRHS